jgi:hypothetical protein
LEKTLRAALGEDAQDGAREDEMEATDEMAIARSVANISFQNLFD